ncbi:DUF2809 domain-containing protein [Arthrobacter jiangjiafuii]|uniref:DUF2809 domain-containing protein n=1 Tax=Arthrobacter jiangjiafuii TaxID=2817475 RepID=A0A975M7D6_9MICC|nr:DUF2809 domain-containing protein [Arthrobacter jiangjiafuii]MBP3044375.1 DUF2809 domain-containing protein [Arthrobacter jiangjiafuii]QWC11320.1 DUF2809 domain-containing protein [Arthrobacter jiangjiafuii]
MSAVHPLKPVPAPRELLPHEVLLRRAALACGAVAVVAAGLWARTGLAGTAGDAAGGILYAVLLYLLLAFAAPRARSLTIAAAAVVLCGVIELFQLTPWPARWAELWPPLRLVLGTTFNPWDLPAYAAGGFAAGLADHLLRRVGASRRR